MSSSFRFCHSYLSIIGQKTVQAFLCRNVNVKSLFLLDFLVDLDPFSLWVCDVIFKKYISLNFFNQFDQHKIWLFVINKMDYFGFHRATTSTYFRVLFKLPHHPVLVVNLVGRRSILWEISSADLTEIFSPICDKP